MTALVRVGADPAKLAKVQQANVKVVEVDLADEEAVARAIKGSVCVVSCIVGLRDVIVDTQSSLLRGSIAAGVPRFIPSDFSIDFTRLPPGSNRNLDDRRDFHAVLQQSNVQWTSILPGVFSSVLFMPQSPLLQPKARQVPYVESPDQVVDITDMDNAADFTAAAALDPSAPRYLRVAGCSVTPRDMQRVAQEVWGEQFELVSKGTLVGLQQGIVHHKVIEAEAGVKSVYPMSQILQYMWCMFCGLANVTQLDNARYPDVQWTGIKEILQRVKQASN